MRPLSPLTTRPVCQAVLGWLFHGLTKLGNAAVPLSLVLLGNALSRGPKWDAVPKLTNAGILLGKMVVMPVLAVGILIAMDKTLEPLGAIKLSERSDEALHLAAAALR